MFNRNVKNDKGQNGILDKGVFKSYIKIYSFRSDIIIK